MEDSQTQADIIAREIRALGLQDFDLTLLVLSPDGSKVVAQVRSTQDIPPLLKGMATRVTTEGRMTVLDVDVDTICPGGVCYITGMDRPSFQVNQGPYGGQINRNQQVSRNPQPFNTHNNHTSSDIPQPSKVNRSNQPAEVAKPVRRYNPPSLQDIQNAQMNTDVNPMNTQPMQSGMNVQSMQQNMNLAQSNMYEQPIQQHRPNPPIQNSVTSPGRSPTIITGYVSHRGVTFNTLEELPRSYNGKDKNALVRGTANSVNSGIFTYISGKWNKCQINGRCLFYDVQMKKLYSVNPLDSVRDAAPSVKDLEIPVFDGDMLLDGNYGQIYVHVGGKWHCDDRCNIRENSRNVSRSLTIDRSMVVPSSVTHLFVNPSGSHITITLPSTDNYTKYETDEGVITEMNPVTISNIGTTDITIIPSDGDSFYGKQKTTKLVRKQITKFIACSNTWFVAAS
uniref:Uncharacterized protein n=1 Tax=viral metagenome TaxID=1070528 RepID=A0A6C0BP23_9ZZZZ